MVKISKRPPSYKFKNKINENNYDRHRIHFIICISMIVSFEYIYHIVNSIIISNVKTKRKNNSSIDSSLATTGPQAIQENENEDENEDDLQSSICLTINKIKIHEIYDQVVWFKC